MADAMPTAASIGTRLDRLPPSRAAWRLILLISLGGCFEFYDLFLTAYATPGLVRSGIFAAGHTGLFGMSDQATFAAATFAGLFVGTIAFARVADRFGRRAIFTVSLLWYSAATVAMALQGSAVGVDVWRFIAGIGIGVELVTIDTYVTELAPKAVRGRSFAINQAIQFAAVPVVALLCWLLVPRDPFGVAGWRFVVLLGAAGAVAVWFIRAQVPESPRWLAGRGRIAEAERIVERLEACIAAETGRALPAPEPDADPATAVAAQAVQGRVGGQAAIKPYASPDGAVRFADIWRPPYRRRTLMLSVFNFFQTIGFYGFGNWVPTLIAAQGASVTHSLQYSFAIAIAYPLGPLLCSTFADRFERKWQICVAALGTASFGLLFSQQTAALALIGLGVLITLSNNLLSFAYHAYQAELFPTRIRATAVGFVYSWSRLSTVFTSLMIGFFLRDFGSTGVFVFIAASMGVVIATIGGFGPRTLGRALEEIDPPG